MRRPNSAKVRRLLKACALAAMAASAGARPMHAQQRRAVPPPAPLPVRPGDARIVLGRPDSAVVVKAAGDSLRDWIVELSAPPLLAPRRAAGEDPAAQVARFRAEFARVDARVRQVAPAGVRLPAGLIRFTYTKVLTAVALRATSASAFAAAQLPYVRQVREDRAVHAALSESVPLIRADQVWSTLGARGEGEVIGIIDTGVDYTHPALGGGFGPAYRVGAGYDFVNNDADPMDDNGHGTHVAAIAAGNGGGIVGVAPGAKLVAYKVLDSNGAGEESMVIAALERAVDPDGDPATHDGADVINLSLSGSGDADDALAHAVDNASAAGVVVVAAAGNDGAYGVIGSPGAARSAVTVGASTKSDALTAFSSRGPTLGQFSLKPDLVAPGEAITSAWPGGGTKTLSGTSMATPHVAGVAALVRQLHPAWSPAHVKAALAESGIDLGADPFAQGGGRVDALRAAQAPVLVVPGSIYVGVVAPGAVVTRQDTLTLVNPGSETRTYTIGAAALPSGFAVAFSVGALTIAAGDSARVVVTLNVDGSTLAHAWTYPYQAAASIVVQGASGTVRIPVVAQSGRLYALAFDRSPTIIVVHDRHGAVVTQCPTMVCTSDFDGLAFDALLPPGAAATADIMLWWQGDSTSTATFLVREGVQPTGPGERLRVPASDATHIVRTRAHDEQGRAVPLAGMLGMYALRYTGPSLYGIYIGANNYDLFRLSSMGSDYLFQWFASETAGTSLYRFGSGVRAIGADTTLDNRPEDLRHRVIAFAGDASRPLYAGIGVANLHIAWTGLAAAQRWVVGSVPLGPERTLQLYRAPPLEDENFPWDFFQAGSDPGSPTLESAYYRLIAPDSVKVEVVDTGFPVLYLGRADTIPVAPWPARWNGRLTLDGSGNSVVGQALGREMTLFPSQTGDADRTRTASWRLSSGGSVIASGTILPGDTAAELIRAQSPGVGALDVSTASAQGADSARATATLDFDASRADRQPPVLTLLQFRVGASFRSRFSSGEPVDMFVGGTDDPGVAEVSAAVRPHGGAAWTDVPLAAEGGGWRARLPTDTAADLDVRVVLRDAAGNGLTYVLEPALYGAGVADVTLGRASFTPGDTALVQAFSVTSALPINRLSWSVRYGDPAGALQYVASQPLGRAAGGLVTAVWTDSSHTVTGTLSASGTTGLPAGAGPVLADRFRLAREATGARLLAADTSVLTIVRPPSADAGVRLISYQVEAAPGPFEITGAYPIALAKPPDPGRITLQLLNGDVDLDGAVTTGDVARVVDGALGRVRLRPTETVLADAYPDTTLDVLDVVRATRLRLGLSAVASGPAAAIASTAGAGRAGGLRLTVSAADAADEYRIAVALAAPISGLEFTLQGDSTALELGDATLSPQIGTLRLERGQGHGPAEARLLLYAPQNEPLAAGQWPLLTIRAQLRGGQALRSPVLQVVNVRAAGPDGRAVEVGTGVFSGLDEAVPDSTSVGLPYPNPFSATRPVHLPLALADPGASAQVQHYRVSVYGVRGELIRVLLDADLAPGHHSIDWDGRNARGQLVSSGVYLLVIAAPAHVERRRLVFVR